ncbi:MAG TPA: hypothetical protein VFX16_32690 [Pseudonocardiaceae bacterium]|nr:hypothetical protein [Pseudonocardiaceae bacterium]
MTAFDRQWAALRAALAGPVPAVLAAWAAELAGQGDALPLLGTGLRGPRYEALLWNGARCPAAAVLITGLLTAPPDTTTDDLAAAVAAGALASEVPTAPGPAVASLATVGCAVTAAMVTSASVDLVVDLAASLMVFSSAAAVPGGTRTDLVRAGHPVASGWLATLLLSAGFAPMPGALAATLAAAGAPAAPAQAATVSGLLDTVR